jgi:hypothetical protein
MHILASGRLPTRHFAFHYLIGTGDGRQHHRRVSATVEQRRRTGAGYSKRLSSSSSTASCFHALSSGIISFSSTPRIQSGSIRVGTRRFGGGTRKFINRLCFRNMNECFDDNSSSLWCHQGGQCATCNQSVLDLEDLVGIFGASCPSTVHSNRE